MRVLQTALQFGNSKHGSKNRVCLPLHRAAPYKRVEGNQSEVGKSSNSGIRSKKPPSSLHSFGKEREGKGKGKGKGNGKGKGKEKEKERGKEEREMAERYL